MDLLDRQKQAKKEIEVAQLRAIRRLCKYFDYNRRDMAEALGVNVNGVYQWFNRGRISAKSAIVAERVTKGAVTKQQLRPDVELWWEE